MQRRTFLKTALAAPIFFNLVCIGNSCKLQYLPATEKGFELLEVSGSYREIGRQIGKYFKKNIYQSIRQQPGMLDKLMAIAESESGKKYSLSLLASVKRGFPHLLDELAGMADGAGLHFNILWYLSIRYELNAFGYESPGSCTVPPGCSTIYYNDGKANWLFHNEDGNIAYKNEMLVLKVHPPSGVDYYSFAYPGCITSAGPSFNSEGIIVTANFIGCKKPEEGVPRFFIGRAILEAKTLKEAIQIVSYNPRAFPWHHSLASVSSGEYISIETLPRNYKKQDSTSGVIEIKKPNKGFPYLHTNHTIGEKTTDYIYQDINYRDSDSVSRLNVLSELRDNQKYPVSDPKVFLHWLSSRKNAPNCPCKVADKRNRGQTLGTAFFDLNTGVFRLYKGAPCQSVDKGIFQEYRF